MNRRSKPARTFHGGPEIKTQLRKSSNPLAGLRLTAPRGAVAPVKTIVRNGVVVDRKAFKRIYPGTRPAESHVTAAFLPGGQACSLPRTAAAGSIPEPDWSDLLV